MKKINPPNVEDIKELQLLANNGRLGSYPHLMNEYIMFREQYELYDVNMGNPWHIRQLPISGDFKKSLITHYNEPPVDRLLFIQEYRRKISPTLCPMCGGFGNGTLDHYLPKNDFPEYSFFSKNLIPACNCNQLRSTTVKGTTFPARVIHPYFDNFLEQRLYQSTFIGGFEAPSISIEVINTNHPEIDILKFHLEKVILNDATLGWFEKYWSDLSLRAHDILDLVLPEDTITGINLKDSIERYRNSKDKEHNTPNNWHSIFYTGLTNDHVRLDELALRINLARQV